MTRARRLPPALVMVRAATAVPARKTPVSGFSLVEVLVASALLVSGVAALVHLLALSSRAMTDAHDTTVASVLAAQKMEELRSGPFPGGPPGEAVEILSGFIRRSTVEPLPRDPLNAVVITVDVSRSGRERPASHLVTIRTRGFR